MCANLRACRDLSIFPARRPPAPNRPHPPSVCPLLEQMLSSSEDSASHGSPRPRGLCPGPSVNGPLAFPLAWAAAPEGQVHGAAAWPGSLLPRRVPASVCVCVGLRHASCLPWRAPPSRDTDVRGRVYSCHFTDAAPWLPPLRLRGSRPRGPREEPRVYGCSAAGARAHRPFRLSLYQESDRFIRTHGACSLLCL